MLSPEPSSFSSLGFKQLNARATPASLDGNAWVHNRVQSEQGKCRSSFCSLPSDSQFGHSLLPTGDSHC